MTRDVTTRDPDWTSAMPTPLVVATSPHDVASTVARVEAAGDATRKAFGWFLIVSGAAYALYRLAVG